MIKEYGVKWYITQLSKTILDNRKLEEEYRGKKRGRIYIARKLLILNKQKRLTGKIKTLGKEYNLIKVEFYLDSKHVEIYWTGVSIEDSKLLTVLNNPNAKDLTAIEIELGIPSIS